MATSAFALFPRVSSAAPTFSQRLVSIYTRGLAQRMLPVLSVALPGLSLRIPSLGEIWESILRAVPKNKTSHSRKRHRQMAGKALQDVTNLCKCPGCGGVKRTHRLCDTCHKEMKEVWREMSNENKLP